MKVVDAQKYIEKIDKEVNNLQKFLELSNEEQEELADKLNINSPIYAIVNISVNSMLAYRNILKEKIENAEI